MAIDLGTTQGPRALEEELALIQKILSGENHLFYDLIRTYERSAYLATYSILRNQHDAEDAVQEAFLNAFRCLADFRGDAKFSTWLLRIAINEARMRLRKERTHHNESIDSQDHDGEDGNYAPLQLSDWRELPSEALERAEVRREIDEALNQLPQSYRDVLVLRDVQQLSIMETATILDMSIGNVKVRLLRARLRMRDILAPKLLSARSSRNPFKKGKNPWS